MRAAGAILYALDKGVKFGACPNEDLRVGAISLDGIYYAFG